jgi:hypothetical protein
MNVVVVGVLENKFMINKQIIYTTN